MADRLQILILINFINAISSDFTNLINENTITTSSYVYWANGVVPFYVNPEHYDHEQTLAIMLGLTNLAFKTCLKFAPVMTHPQGSQHVMVFQNPRGLKYCDIQDRGHSLEEPHYVNLGYNCLKSPDLEMMVLRALGLPFEHNRLVRDLYIDVQTENVEMGYQELFTKDTKLPHELRNLPYDMNSVMHFGERQFSKNGHRTIIIKNSNNKQNRVGLTELDIKKVDIIYGPECRKRDRMEKIELCQGYPAVARKKRELPDVPKSLRVNPDITPPPNITNAKDNIDLPYDLKELGIHTEVQKMIDQVYKISALALSKARIKYCNETKTDVQHEDNNSERKKSDVLHIIKSVAEYAQTMVNHAVDNLTDFCENADSISSYQRSGCGMFDNSRCIQHYKSTKSGDVKYSTQHRPYIRQSTQHKGPKSRNKYENIFRARNDSGENKETITKSVTEKLRRKREASIYTKSNVTVWQSNITSTPIRNPLEIETEQIPMNSSVNRTQLESNSNVSLDEHTRRLFKYLDDPDDNKQFLTATSKKLYKRSRDDSGDEDVAYKSDDEHNHKKYSSGKSEERRPKMDSYENGYKHNKETRFKKTNGKKEITNAKKKFSEEEYPYKKINEAKPKKPILSSQENNGYEDHQGKRPISDDISTDQAEGEVEGIGNTNGKQTPKTVKLSKKNEEFYEERRWPDGIVRYIITDDGKYDLEDLRQRLAQVNNILRRKTCVRLQEIQEEDASQYEDYLVLNTNPDYVTGRVGGRQVFGSVELFQGGQHRQHTAMMVMAMLGFYFEVARHDRDKFIRVHVRHIRPDKLHHFEKIRDDATLPLPYDYKSAMHPAWQFWRRIGKTGISTVATYKEQDPDGSIMKSLGQHSQLLSELDIVKINSVYGLKCLNHRRSRKQRKKTRNLKFI